MPITPIANRAAEFTTSVSPSSAIFKKPIENSEIYASTSPGLSGGKSAATLNPDILSSFFSDETDLCRIPAEPDPFDKVTLRFRTQKGSVSRVSLYIFGQDLDIEQNPADAQDSEINKLEESADSYSTIQMGLSENDEYFDWYSALIRIKDIEVSYCFLIETSEGSFIYDKTGLHTTPCPDKSFAFRFTPGFHVPEWTKGAVQYQIFTDRFRNGNPGNDVRDNEYYYINGHSRHAKDWAAPLNDRDIRTFFGGDLQGVMEKLDYLQDLGVEAIYFNPLFVSPSSHKYDIQDYDHIDPHFAVIEEDLDHPMETWERHNGFAAGYITRTTSLVNLEKSNEYFAGLCREMHRRGMKVILDGVFNHCGSFNKWMDREGIYLSRPGFDKGAYQDKGSPYRSYFRFSDDTAPARIVSSTSGIASMTSSASCEYEGWWGHNTLPKLNYDDSPELTEEILRIAEKWASPPYSIDAWRLDVAADLGHTPEFNHRFWQEFRKRVKAVNPDILIIAEHYGDPSSWLHGDQWDTVMNYDAFMDPVGFFLTGMEKHSDWRRDDLYRNGKAFFDTMAKNMAKFQRPSLDCAMNELSNHDHSRFLTRTNRKSGRLADLGPDAAGEGTDRGVFMQAVVMQMTWPGAPTIYYGDETGMVGWTDPDNRRTYPWGSEDRELIALHKYLTGLRKSFPELKTGSFKPMFADDGIVSYARFSSGASGYRAVFTVVNNSDSIKRITLRARDSGISDGSHVTRRLLTYDKGFLPVSVGIGVVDDGNIIVELPAGTSAIYTAG